VTTPAPDSKTADDGKVQVKIVGPSTQRPWTRRSIPNLNVDFDEFVEGQRIGGFEHLRFNNAQVGSIFRERLTLELFARLGYPAPRATYAWVSSNVWGPNVAIPYIVVERYKRSFCERWADEIGGAGRRSLPVSAVLRGHQPGPKVVPIRAARRRQFGRSWLTERRRLRGGHHLHP
jgi:hypothetical protein